MFAGDEVIKLSLLRWSAAAVRSPQRRLWKIQDGARCALSAAAGGQEGNCSPPQSARSKRIITNVYDLFKDQVFNI